MRTMHMTVTGDNVTLDSAVAGVQGSGNVDKLVVSFDPSWDGYAKTVAWWDAHGDQAGEPRVLTADLLVDPAADARHYILVVPPKALALAGRCTLVIDGYLDGALARTASQEFEVVPAPASAKAGTMPPSQAQQLQAEVEALLDAEVERQKAERERQEAEAQRHAVSQEILDEARAQAQAAAGSAQAAAKKYQDIRDYVDDARTGIEDSLDLCEENAYDASERAKDAERSAQAAAKEHQDIQAYVNDSRMEMMDLVGSCQESAADAKRDAQDAAEYAEYADEARDAAAEAASEAETLRNETEEAAGRAETVQAALQLRDRVYIGPAAMAADMLPGDVLIIDDGGTVTGGASYQDLLAQAQKAAAGEANTLAQLATLSTVTGTNWRRDGAGALWTTDTLAEFRDKLTAFAAAAVAGGYTEEGTGLCSATWSQAQYWLINGRLATPLEADAAGYPWRTDPPKTKLDGLMERQDAIEKMLEQMAEIFSALTYGGGKG